MGKLVPLVVFEPGVLSDVFELEKAISGVLNKHLFDYVYELHIIHKLRERKLTRLLTNFYLFTIDM